MFLNFINSFMQFIRLNILYHPDNVINVWLVYYLGTVSNVFSINLTYSCFYSLDIDYGDFNRPGRVKSDALHLWTANKLDAAAIKHYFRSYNPSFIRWSSHNECK